jgi:hypothetical protein
VGTGTVGVFKGTTEAKLSGTTLHSGSLAVEADHQSRFFVAAGGVSVGAAAMAGTFVVGVDQSTTLAHVDGSKVDTAGAVTVDSDGSSEIRSWGVSGALAGAAGVAGNAVVSVVGNTTQAYVVNSEIGSAGAQAGSLSVTAFDKTRWTTRRARQGWAFPGTASEPAPR